MEELFQKNRDILENKFTNMKCKINDYDLYRDIHSFIHKKNIVNILKFLRKQ